MIPLNIAGGKRTITPAANTFAVSTTIDCKGLAAGRPYALLLGAPEGLRGTRVQVYAGLSDEAAASLAAGISTGTLALVYDSGTPEEVNWSASVFIENIVMDMLRITVTGNAVDDTAFPFQLFQSEIRKH